MDSEYGVVKRLLFRGKQTHICMSTLHFGPGIQPFWMFLFSLGHNSFLGMIMRFYTGHANV